MGNTAITACVLIIGNEILSGRTAHSNLNYIALTLGGWGIQVREARVIPDVVDDIVSAVNAARGRYHYVFTTGGIGPTHDDITVDCIAKAFDVPIVETLRQILEAWDGSGTPLGLKGQEILKSARVIAVANAFVGLVSPRAYRNGLDFDGAVDALLKDSAHKFDRSVVAALVNYLDNQGGRERWADFRSKPSGH